MRPGRPARTRPDPGSTPFPATAGGGLGAVHALGARHAIAPRLADAFQHTHGWAVALMAVASLPALLLPLRR